MTTSSSNAHSSSSNVGSVTSTAVLHSRANSTRRDALLDALGGTHTLHAAVDHFYDKVVADPDLQPFFAHSDVQLLKWHQFNFMSIAFAHVPEDFDITALILVKHSQFFEMGMNEKHFDLVVDYFTVTLKDLGIEDAMVEEALEMLSPIRPLFREGAALAKSKQRSKERHHHALRTAAVLGFISYVAVHWFRNRRRSI